MFFNSFSTISLIIVCILSLFFSSCAQKDFGFDPDHSSSYEYIKCGGQCMSTDKGDHEKIEPAGNNNKPTDEGYYNNGAGTGVSGSSSSLMIEHSLQDLVALADLIVLGTITDSVSSWNKEKTSIYTFHTLLVKEYFKSTGKDRIIIKVPGGAVDDIKQHVEDAANFKIEEEVLVFLNYNEDETYSIVGGFQGRYSYIDGIVDGLDLALSELVELIKLYQDK